MRDGVHLKFVAQQSCIQVTVGGRGQLQVGLDLLVGGVFEAPALDERAGRGHAREYRVIGTGAVHNHADGVEQHRLAQP